MVEFSKNKWKYTTIGLLAVLAVGFSFPQAFAAPIDSVLAIVRDIQAKVNDSTFGLQAIKNAINNGASQSSVNSLQTDVTAIKTSQYIPFVDILSDEVLCVAKGDNSEDHEVVITSGSIMMITSVIVQPNGTLSNTDFVAAPFVTTDGNKIFIGSANFAPTGATPTDRAFEIMGNTDQYPDEIAGSTVKFGMFCQHDVDDENLAFKKIVVSGWKMAGASTTVSFQ